MAQSRKARQPSYVFDDSKVRFQQMFVPNNNVNAYALYYWHVGKVHTLIYCPLS